MTLRVSFDESFRLEPTQLAGFIQSFRTIIPESIVGSASVPHFETAGSAIDIKLKRRTYLSFQGELLRSDVARDIGVFDYPGVFPFNRPAVPSRTENLIEYKESSLAVIVNHLASEEWAYGTEYRFTRSDLRTLFPLVPTAVNAGADRQERADLHHLDVFAVFNHRSGIFARVDSIWTHQQNAGYTPVLPLHACVGRE